MMTAEKADGKIVCKIDGGLTHSIQMYLRDNHPEWTLERYKREFPGEPLLSDAAKRKYEAIRAAKSAESTASKRAGPTVRPFHEVFEFGTAAKAAFSKKGEPIPCPVLDDHDDDAQAYVPDIDPNYVFTIDLVKTILVGITLNTPMLMWGMHGTGKTTLFEQFCARTNRPFMRIQHTINTEEAHIVGQYIVKDGATEFQLGPLPIAMINGYCYCADEYDFAMPSVLSVYQPVMEGKPLVIKDAPTELRVIRPHPNFRFMATGNTNGGGDETGLYQGTQIQNAANYSRFGIVEEVGYMEPKIESLVIMNQAGIEREDANKLVNIAKEVRDAFRAGKISTTISPRELINAAKLGLVRGGEWKLGLKQAFTNRLSRVDKEVIEQVAQRYLG